MNSIKLEIEILYWQILEGIPSASGIVKFKDLFYLIGDDSPYLFCIDNNFKLLSKTLIYSREKSQDGIIAKIDKPDFEAMEMISDTEMLVFGSGSKSPERDVCVWVEIGEESIDFKQYDISEFYAYLKNLDIMKGHELDIEGLAVYSEKLFLLNRARNIIFSFPLKDFMAYCRGNSGIPMPQTKYFDLPKIDGLQSGFSGATFLTNNLIFTSSVEDSPNTYDDGEIFGSFLGLLKYQNDEFLGDPYIAQIPNPGFPLKVESVILDKVVSESEIEVVVVTDNDGETSQILRLLVRLNDANTIKFTREEDLN